MDLIFYFSSITLSLPEYLLSLRVFGQLVPTSCLPIISRTHDKSPIYRSLLLGLLELVNPPTKVTSDTNLQTYDAGLLQTGCSARPVFQLMSSDRLSGPRDSTGPCMGNSLDSNLDFLMNFLTHRPKSLPTRISKHMTHGFFTREMAHGQ